MPTLENLETLKNQINRLGDELRLLSERGETLNDVAPPEVPADADLERLLSDDSPPMPDDGVDAMEALLDNYSDDIGIPLPELPGELPADEEFNLDDLIEPEGDDLPGEDLGYDDSGLADIEELIAAADSSNIPDAGTPPIDIDDFGDFSNLDALGALDEPDDTLTIDNLDVADDIMDDVSIEDPASDEVFTLDDMDFGEGIIDSDEKLDAGAAVDETPDPLDSLEDFGDIDTGDDFSFDGLDDLSLDDLPADERPGEEMPMEEAPVEPIEAENIQDDSFGLDALDLGELEETVDEPADLEDLDSTDLTDTDLSDAGFSDDDFSLDDLDFDESAGDLELSESDDNGGLEELGELTLDDDEDIPDVESALENLGNIDDAGENDIGELSLDDDLNFDDELGTDILSDIREAGDDSQQFSMDDFGEQYNFKEGEAGFAENLGVDLEKLEQSLDDANENEEKPFALDDEDYQDIIRTLATLPRNLKMAIEELLADERHSPADLKPIVNGLIDGSTPKVLAAAFQQLTKRKIELPRSYEKRSGLDLESRRASMAYRLIREGWPVIRTVLLIIAIVWTLGAAVFMWVIRPIWADRLYKEGLALIALDEVDSAVERFHDAWDGWPLFDAPDGGDRIGDSPVIVKGWHDKTKWLDYARSLRRRKHWDAADSFYSGYLYEKPDARDVRLEYAEFLSSVLGRYDQAINVLDSAPRNSRGNPGRDYMLAAGDVYLRWAEDDPTMYEQARYRYAKVLETSRNDEKAILSMMRYHLRVGNHDEVTTLLPIFRTEVPGKTSEPELAAEVYAGLGAWHLDRQDEGGARRFLDLALTADPLSPEPHYVDARYWQGLGAEAEELEALRLTLVALEGRESMSRDELEMRILTLGGLGRLHYSLASRLTTNDARAEARSLATTSYSKALNLYEDARDRNQLGASPQYGRLYLELGDVLFAGTTNPDDLVFTFADTSESITMQSDRNADLVRAESYYNEAEALFDRGNGGTRLPDNSLYRRAYARYVLNLDGALVDFHRVTRRRPNDYEARLALATVLLKSGDYEASRSQYARSIELLDDELRRTGGTLNPLDRQGHEELLIRYIYAWNNLGVGRARSAARGGGDEDYAAALTAFTMASEYYDEVYSDMPDLVERVGMLALRNEDDVRISEVESESGNIVWKERQTIPYLNRQTLLGLETSGIARDTYLMYPDIPSDLSYSESR